MLLVLLPLLMLLWKRLLVELLKKVIPVLLLLPGLYSPVLLGSLLLKLMTLGMLILLLLMGKRKRLLSIDLDLGMDLLLVSM